MNARFLRLAGLTFVLSTMMLFSACHKKSAPVAPAQTPPPAPAKPTATLTVSPTSVQRGGSVQLTWSAQEATDVNIDPIGVVPASGTRTLIPRVSTTYSLTAKGPGGSVQQTARVTVTEPPPPPMEESTAQHDAALFEHSMKDIYFNYDKYDVRPEDAVALKADAEFLAAHSNYKVVISGHCDERGSADYNVALGSSRANAVRDELVKLGVASDRIKTISYGKEKPFCTEENEKCWQQNRRAHFTLGQ
jgi:peptidoglycan-associated lipoprotein